MHNTQHPGSVVIVLETALGDIEIAIFSQVAPASAAAVLALVDNGRLAAQGTFYRAVRKESNDRGQPPIDVVQGGLHDDPDNLMPIEHESTAKTGLRHIDGAVSLARDLHRLPSATGASFFICLGENPALDAGGTRTQDRQGFAVFGRVTAGMDVVRTMHRLPTDDEAADAYLRGQILKHPVRITAAHRRHIG
jgi:peptidyl-prolyl cis-trans isomerase A (cyclophilin A)